MVRFTDGSGWMRSAALAAAVVLLAPAGAAEDRPAGQAFVAETLAEHVHLLRPADPSPARTNSLVVERRDGLLVVGAQPDPAAARELLAAVSRLSEQRVRYLVLMHPHADAAAGATAFPEETLRIATSGYRDRLKDPGHDFLAEQRRWRSPKGGPEPALPVLVIGFETILDDPDRPVVLSPIGHAHTAGDLLVWIPDTGVVMVGSLIFGRGEPYARDGNFSGWIRALNKIATAAPTHVVPLRGAVIDAQGVRVQREAFLWIRGQIGEAFVDAVPPADIPDRLLEQPSFYTYFDASVPREAIRPLIELAVEEARALRRKRGLPD